MSPAPSPASVPAPEFLFDGPARAERVLLFAHGAGAPMDHAFMTTVARGVAEHGIRVARFQFPYMAARRAGGRRGAPDRPPVLLATYRAAIDALRPRARVLVIGGKSMGGRIATMVADEAGVEGVVVLGYPFHPAGRPTQLRTEHLERMRTPALILQSERDAMGARDEVAALTLNMALASLTFGSTLRFLGVRLEAIGIAPFLIGVAFSIESLAGGLSQPGLGYLADRVSRRGLVVAGLLGAAAMLDALGLATQLWVVLALLFGMGVGSSASMVGSGAIPVAVGRRVGMGTVVGLGSAGSGAGLLGGSVAGGCVVGLAGSPAAAFYFGGAMMLLGMPLFLSLTRGHRDGRAGSAARPAGACARLRSR